MTEACSRMCTYIGPFAASSSRTYDDDDDDDDLLLLLQQIEAIMVGYLLGVIL